MLLNKAFWCGHHFLPIPECWKSCLLALMKMTVQRMRPGLTSGTGGWSGQRWWNLGVIHKVRLREMGQILHLFHHGPWGVRKPSNSAAAAAVWTQREKGDNRTLHLGFSALLNAKIKSRIHWRVQNQQLMALCNSETTRLQSLNFFL